MSHLVNSISPRYIFSSLIDKVSHAGLHPVDNRIQKLCKPVFNQIVLGLVIPCLTVPIATLISLIIHLSPYKSENESNIKKLIKNPDANFLIETALKAPILEELIFRYVIQTSIKFSFEKLLPIRQATYLSIGITSILFALAHSLNKDSEGKMRLHLRDNLPQVINTLFLGTILGTAKEIIPYSFISISIHYGNNIFVCALVCFLNGLC